MLLAVIGTGGTIPIRDATILSMMNNNMPPLLGWVMWLVVVGRLRGASSLLGLRAAGPRGCRSGSPVIPLLRVVVLAVLLGVVVLLFNQERSINPALKSLKGVPMIVPVAIVLRASC